MMSLLEELHLEISISTNCWGIVAEKLQSLAYRSKYMTPYVLRSVLHGCIIEKDELIINNLQQILRDHLTLFPPSREGMHEFYRSFLIDEFIDQLQFCSIDSSKYTFWNVVDILKDIVTEESFYERIKDKLDAEYHHLESSSTSENYCLNNEIDRRVRHCKEMLKDCIATIRDLENQSAVVNRTMVNKIFFIFETYMELFELDLADWCAYEKSEGFDSNACTRRPLLAMLIWEKNTKVLNYSFSYFTELYFCCVTKRKYSIAKCISLFADITRMNEKHLWYKCDENCDTLASTIFSCMIGKPEKSEFLQLLSSTWLQIKIASYIIKGDCTISSLQSVTRFIQGHLFKKWGMSETGGELTKELADPKKKKRYFPNKRNKYGQTILHTLAKKNNHIELETVLRLPEANINTRDNFGWTPLHEAAKNGSTECINIMFKYRLPPISGADMLDVHCVSQNGISPLMDAVDSEHLKAVELLLGTGAVFTMKDKSSDGIDAFGFARDDNMSTLLASYLQESNWPSFLCMEDKTIELLSIIVMALLNEGKSDINESFKNQIDELHFLISKLVLESSNPHSLASILHPLNAYKLYNK